MLILPQTHTQTHSHLKTQVRVKSHKCVKRSKVRELPILTHPLSYALPDRHSPEPPQILCSSITS